MKSFTDQQTEELNKKVKLDEATAGDFLLGLGAAGGLLALKKAWDTFGKGSKLARGLKFTKKGKAAVDQDKLDKAKTKQDQKDTKADADALKYEKDDEGNIKNVKDAQAYKDKTDKAPPGWETSTGKGAFKKIKAGAVVQKATADKMKQDYEAEREKGGQKLGAGQGKANLAKKKEPKTDKPSANTSSPVGRTDAPRKVIGTSHEPKGNMTITESNELQAIMALDDAGISAEINRKGQVVVKKKDLKKAEKALKKSFKKGGEPKLVGEETIGDVLDQIVVEAELEEASSKKARNKAADEIEAIADKGGAEAPALFSLASKLRKGTHSTTGLKLSKKVTAILKVNGIKEEVQKTRTAYEVVSKARKRSIKNKPQWEQE